LRFVWLASVALWALTAASADDNTADLATSHIFKFGTQPVSFQFGARYYPIHLDDSATWGARLAVVFLFPE
jgi:hypothetical protein